MVLPSLPSPFVARHVSDRLEAAHMACCKVSKKTSIVFAALFWICGAVSTGMKAYELLKTAEILDSSKGKYRFTVLVLLGVVLGFLQCYFVFVKVCNKNIDRILNLSSEPRWHECYRWQFYIFLACVIAIGAATTKVYAEDFWVIGINGCLDTMVSISLSFSLIVFYVRRKEWMRYDGSSDQSKLLAPSV